MRTVVALYAHCTAENEETRAVVEAARSEMRRWRKEARAEIKRREVILREYFGKVLDEVRAGAEEVDVSEFEDLDELSGDSDPAFTPAATPEAGDLDAPYSVDV